MNSSPPTATAGPGRASARPAGHRLCLAPMMDRTDRHFRYLLRLISRRTFLYTEMITSAAIVRGDARALLRYAAAEHPVALQLGGSDPEELAAAARIAADMGYDEINLNAGCPSDRVQAGCFGAALMLNPERVAECLAAMRGAVAVPVTVKTRLGVDHHDSYEFLRQFVDAVVAAGCETLILHARKAWLAGLSPKQNREVPPLDYGRVHRVAHDYPALDVILNGGLRTPEDVLANRGALAGAMLGRAAYERPMVMDDLERALFGGSTALPLAEVVTEYLAYVRRELRNGEKLRNMTRHLTGLAFGRPGARAWRRDVATLRDSDQAIRHLSLRAGQLFANG